MTGSKALSGIVDPPDSTSLFPHHLSDKLKRKLMQFVLRIAVPGRKAVTARSVFSGVESPMRGRCTEIVPVDDASNLDVLPTMRTAIYKGLKPPMIPVPKRMWRRCIRKTRPQITVMLIIDASRSSKQYLASLGEVLKTLFGKYMDPASKVGMVAIQNGNAKMLFSPTRNRLRVFGRIKELESGGYTPLEPALRIAGTELSRLRRLDSSYRPFILLVSDCYPEPVPPDVGDVYESKLYRQVRLQANLIAHAKLPIVVVDPSDPFPGLAERMPGRKLARYIARKTNGTFISMPAMRLKFDMPLRPKFISEELKKSEAYKIAEELDALTTTMSRIS